MTIRRLPLLLALIAILGGCSSKSNNVTASTQPASAAVTSATSAVASAVATKSASAAASGAATSKVTGGGAADFCTAFKEFKTAVQADTPQAKGAGFRAAAADLRKFAPAEIKDGAAAYADVLDEVGRAIQAGQQAPEVLGSGQSAQRRQGMADAITWITKNCQQ